MKNKRFAATVKVGEKGQIVIPKEVRAQFDIRAGDTLLLLADPARGIGIVKDHLLFEAFADKLGFSEEAPDER